jgi:hypothetical protein
MCRPGRAEDALLLAEPAAVEEVAGRVRALTGLPVSLAEGDPAGHEALVEQHWIESGSRA